MSLHKRVDEKDTRTLNQDAQEEIRRQAMRLVGNGKSKTEVADLLGVGRSTVSRWFSRYKDGGWAALRKRKRGRAFGTDRLLDKAQEQEVQKTIVDKMPDQLKMAFALWSRRAVQQLVMDKYGIRYTLQGIGKLLKDWGFTPQRPAKRAIERNDEAVRKWKDEEYPQLAARANAEKAEIWWADESYFGGVRKGKRGRGAAGKVAVFGLLNRGCKVYTAIIPNAKTETLLPIIKERVKPDSIVYTDTWRSYNALYVSDFRHERINHSVEFADEKNHINGIKNFWNQDKRHMRKFNGIQPASFYWFLKECEWRFNGGDHKRSSTSSDSGIGGLISNH